MGLSTLVWIEPNSFFLFVSIIIYVSNVERIFLKFYRTFVLGSNFLFMTWIGSLITLVCTSEDRDGCAVRCQMGQQTHYTSSSLLISCLFYFTCLTWRWPPYWMELVGLGDFYSTLSVTFQVYFYISTFYFFYIMNPACSVWVARARKGSKASLGRACSSQLWASLRADGPWRAIQPDLKMARYFIRAFRAPASFLIH